MGVRDNHPFCVYLFIYYALTGSMKYGDQSLNGAFASHVVVVVAVYLQIVLSQLAPDRINICQRRNRLQLFAQELPVICGDEDIHHGSYK